MPNFETFTKKATRTGTGPLVSIQRGGVFSLNADAYALLGKPAAVEFVFAPQERIMGFRPATAEAPHAYVVRQQRGTASYLVSGRAFSKYAGIPLDHGVRYRAELVDGVLAVDLTEPPVSTRKPRPKKSVRAAEASPITAARAPDRGAH
jgi:hypothetical protein